MHSQDTLAQRPHAAAGAARPCCPSWPRPAPLDAFELLRSARRRTFIAIRPMSTTLIAAASNRSGERCAACRDQQVCSRGAWRRCNAARVNSDEVEFMGEKTRAERDGAVARGRLAGRRRL
eukprot:6887130-Prymnesium_polylepis.1